MSETRTAVRSYSSNFEHDEDPISEGGLWLNGLTDGIDWIDCYVHDGVVTGKRARNSQEEKRAEQGNLDSDDAAPTGDYDDPTAILTGEWGPNQHGKGVAFIRNRTLDFFQEIQIRVRKEMKPNWCRGYEFIWRAIKSPESYVEIVRWNGKIGDWTSLKRAVGEQYGIEDGDVLEGKIEGSTLTAYVNGLEVITVDDEKYTDGAPGIGFNFGVGDTYADHGFRFLEFHTYND